MRHDDGKNAWLPAKAAEDCHVAILLNRKRFGLGRDVIEIGLEGRTDADYIETRACKHGVTHGVTIEALLTWVLKKRRRSFNSAITQTSGISACRVRFSQLRMLRGRQG
jgi:hypothetical protein